MQVRSSNPGANRRIVLAARPQGEPRVSDFRLEEGPVSEVGPSQVLLETMYLSLDPYMRGLMREESDDPNYAAPLPLGNVIPGGTVSRVAQSRHAEFAVGDVVLSSSGWQEYQVSSGRGL